MRIPFFLIIFCLFVFSCKSVPTEKDLNIILSSKLSTVNLLISKGNITGVASPRTKSKNSFEIVNFNNEINVTYFTSPFYSDTVFKFNLSNEEIDSLFLILKEVVRTHNPNKKYEGCCMCSNTDIYITNGNISLDIKPSKETEYLIYNLVEKYRLILYENHINYRDSLIYRDSVDGNFLKQNVDEENLKDLTFVEQHLKAMFENDIISVTEDSLFFVIPFDIHGFDCGAPDCYETVVSFGFEKSQPVKFPNQLKFSEFTLGCVEERKQVKGVFTLEEENEEVIIYNSKSSKKSLLLLKQRGNNECYAYYFDKYEANVTSKNFKDLLRYDENTEENKVPFSSYILSIRNEPNYIH